MKKVLVVDDEPEVRDYLREILAGDGYCVTLAADVKEAMDCQISEKYDLVLMDLQMPRISGREILDVLRMKDPALPIIILSGHIESKEELLQLGATKVLPKPVDMRMFLDEVRDLLR